MTLSLRFSAIALALLTAAGALRADDAVLSSVSAPGGSCENCEGGSYSGDSYYAPYALRHGTISNYVARYRASSPYHLDRFSYDAAYGYIGHGGVGLRAHEARVANNAWVLGVAQSTPWHGQYYHTNYGRPLALVVPPTAALQTKWAWGVGNTVSVPIYHQFGRSYPGPYGVDGSGYGFMPTPLWPSNTDQFGVYYVRGPW